MKTLRDEIRAKYPSRAARAGKSAKSAIRLFCIECCGGDTGEARRCQVTDCFLWPHVKSWREQTAPKTKISQAAVSGTSWCGNAAHSSEPHINNGDCYRGEPSDVGKRPPPRAKATKAPAGPVLDRTPGALVGRTLRRVEADGQVRECIVTERGFEYGGAVYTSISAAAKAASGRKAANGWEYWRS